MSKGKGKAPAKSKKTASQLASDKRYGTDKAPKKGLGSVKKDTGKGFKMGKKSRSKVSGRTRLGEAPDAMNIYKGR